jgi:hypothetical protein
MDPLLFHASKYFHIWSGPIQRSPRTNRAEAFYLSVCSFRLYAVRYVHTFKHAGILLPSIVQCVAVAFVLYRMYIRLFLVIGPQSLRDPCHSKYGGLFVHNHPSLILFPTMLPRLLIRLFVTNLGFSRHVPFRLYIPFIVCSMSPGSSLNAPVYNLFLPPSECLHVPYYVSA